MLKYEQVILPSIMLNKLIERAHKSHGAIADCRICYDTHKQMELFVQGC